MEASMSHPLIALDKVSRSMKLAREALVYAAAPGDAVDTAVKELEVGMQALQELVPLIMVHWKIKEILKEENNNEQETMREILKRSK
jgi:hypothetical protein